MKSYFNWKKVGLLFVVLLSISFPSHAIATPEYQDDPKAEADRLRNLGDDLLQSGQDQAALNEYEAALALYQKAGDRSGEGLCLYAIGFVKTRLADYPGALEFFKASLPIWQEIVFRKGEGETTYNIGFIYTQLGQHEQALDYFQKALLIKRELGDRAGEGNTLNNIGLAYDELGQYDRGLDYFQQALAIQRELDDRAGLGDTLTHIGVANVHLGQYPQALDNYQQVLAIQQELGDRAGEAVTLQHIGRVYNAMGPYSQALDNYQKALIIEQEIGDRAGEVTMLNQIGVVHIDMGQYPQALDYYQKALAIAQEISDRAGEQDAIHNIGNVYSALGQHLQALDYYQQALAIAQEIGDRAGEAITRQNIGAVYSGMGQFGQALDYAQQALAIQQELGDREATWYTLNTIGIVYGDLGNYTQALDNFQQALDITRTIGDREGEGTTLNNIGQIYSVLGHYSQALDNYQKGLAIAQEFGDRAGEGTTLNSIGQIYLRLGQSTKALDNHKQALVIAQELGDREAEGNALSYMGDIYLRLGQYGQALDYFQKALAIAQEIGDRAGEGMGLYSIGDVYVNLEQYTQALDYAQKALAIMQEIGYPAGEVRTLQSIGAVYRDLGQYPQALEYFQQALVIWQTTGDRAGESLILDEIGLVYSRQGNNARAITYYQQAIDVTESIQSEIRVEELKTSFAAEQIVTYQRLINLLCDGSRFQEAFNYVERARARAFLDGLAGGAVDFRTGANATLLEREQILKAEITTLRDQLITLRNRSQIEWDMEAIAAVQGELASSEAKYTELLTNIKLQSPEVASLVSVDVASLPDIQSLLDSSTTLVEYFVTEDRTLAFIITHDAFETVLIDVSQDNLTQTITTFRDFANLDNPHPASLKQLYGWLIAPVKDKLKTPVLGIIPHDVLHYLPFAALSDGTRFLSDDYTLFTLPSASVLRFIQDKRKLEEGIVLALGNPTTDLPSLQFAEQEAGSLAHLYRTQALVGTTATESSVWDQARNAGILHLAAHGEYNPYNPLFSAIHLTRDARNDGRLEVHEVYSLDLTVATNLVVLSACETNVGAMSAGDEVVGLNRAFLYAGTPTVISSLWNVDDAATALLMERFYIHLRVGMGKGKALRQAQIDVRVKYPHPYYWASFVLTGDPGPVGKTQSILPFSMNSWTLWAGGIGSSLLCIVVGGFSVLFAARSAEKRRLRKQLDILLEDRQRWMSQPDSPMRARVLRQISHKLREIGRKEQPR
jgi:tetratricopeptide (TPR) repeat protein/CHAT domain-containing protein